MNKSKGFSKSYDQKRRQNSSGANFNANHRRDSSYKNKKYGSRDAQQGKLGYNKNSFQSQKRSKSINNKIALSKNFFSEFKIIIYIRIFFDKSIQLLLIRFTIILVFS